MSAVYVAIGTGTLLKMYGTGRAGANAQLQSEMEASSRENEALQLEANAKESVAVSQRRALEQKRQSDLMASRALAYAAAGGGGSDKSVVNIISDLKGEGSYRAMLEMYDGESQAQKMKYQAYLNRTDASQARNTGKEYRKAARISQFGDLISGATSMYTKFNPAATGGFTGNYASSPASYAGGYSYTDPNDYSQAKKFGLVR